jgi:Antirestriction protein (ArdA).
MTPANFVSDLAAYNEGTVTGEWLTLPVQKNGLMSILTQ